MMVRSTLVAEGSTDGALGPMLTWLLERHLPQADVETTHVLSMDELSGIAKADLVGRMRRALDHYPCEILFVHRDADSEDDAPRYEEIRRAVAHLAPAPPVIAVVSIQAVEAWLMFHADALFHAVRKRARVAFDLPPLRTVQSIAHPKQRFHALLRAAHAETGRAASAFRPHHADYYIAIADFIAATPQGFEPLLDPRNQVTAFQRLSASIVALAPSLNW